MAQPTIKFLTSDSVSVTNGSKTVNVTALDTYHVYNGTTVFIGNYPRPVEAIAGTTPDSSGNSVITLSKPWSNPTVTDEPMIAYNTIEGLTEAIRNTRAITAETLILMEKHQELLTTAFTTNGFVGIIEFNDDFEFTPSVSNELIVKAAKYYINEKIITVPESVVTFPNAPTSSSLTVRYDLAYLTEDGVYHTVAGTTNEKLTSLSDFGWSFLGDDLWELNGIHAVEIARIKRLNTGAYSGEYNENGAGYKGAAGWLTNNRPTSLTDCFTGQTGGNIGSTSGRTDGQFYDSVLPAYFDDLRYSVLDRPVDEIREEYKRKAIAGTVRGFEQVPFTKVLDLGLHTGFGVFGDNGTRIDFPVNTIDFSIVNNTVRTRKTVKGTFGYVVGKSTQTIFGVHSAYQDEVGLTRVYIPSLDYTSEITAETVGWYYLPSVIQSFDLIDQGVSTNYEQFVGNSMAAEHTWTDIIGDPVRIAATFPNGVYGQWIPEIPAASSNQSFSWNRKNVDGLNRIFTLNDGATWGTTAPFEPNSTNEVTGSFGVNEITLVVYTTPAHFIEDDVKSTVVSLGGVLGTVAYHTAYGALLTSTLINKIPTSGSDSSNWQLEVPLNRVQMHAPTGNLSWTASNYQGHIPLELTTDDSPAVKTLDYLSTDGEGYKLAYAYKEMVYGNNSFWKNGGSLTITGNNQAMVSGNFYRINTGIAPWVDGLILHCINNVTITNWTYTTLTNNGQLVHRDLPIYNNTAEVENSGSGWGDNSEFEIADNQNTLTDWNGNTVLYGTASFPVPYRPRKN